MWFLNCKLTGRSFFIKKKQICRHTHCMQLHKWIRATQQVSTTAEWHWEMLWKQTARQLSWVLTEAAAIAVTNYCPLRVTHSNDRKGSITNELLEMAVQNSWAAERSFIGTDGVAEEEISLPGGVERGSFLHCEVSMIHPGAALQKFVLCFRALENPPSQPIFISTSPLLKHL